MNLPSTMKLGPLDFTQPSTWRGLLGLLALGGWALSPELRDQIAITLAAALSAIELFRDEYRANHATAITGTAETTGPNRPMATRLDTDATRLRVPSVSPSPTVASDLDNDPAGFGDR